MFAIVDIAGQQFKVEKDQELFVHRLEGNEGDAVQFDEVLLIDNDGKVLVGTPVIEGAQVRAKITEHLKANKVLVFKKKRRKGYQKLNGHRQYMTKLVIEEIIEKGAKPAAKKETRPAARKETKPAAESSAPKPTAKAEEVKKEKKTEVKAKAEQEKPVEEKKAETRVEKKEEPVKVAPKAEAEAKDIEKAPKEEKKEDQSKETKE